MEIQSLFVYPVKSLNGVSQTKTHCFEHGFQHDRNWMLVDAQNNFITRRECPSVARIDLQEEAHAFILRSGSEILQIHKQFCDSGKTIASKVWQCDVVGLLAEGSAFFSDFLKQPVKLIRMQLPARRLQQLPGSSEVTPSSYADSFPILLIGSASMRALNENTEAPIDERYFRPNIVLRTQRPFEEDQLRTIEIGGVVLKRAKSCGRCRMINVHPETGEYRHDVMRALAGIRSCGKQVLFGQLFYPVRTGEISIDAHVTITETAQA